MKHFEPVVKKSTSYSILLLKDDSKVVRFRLRPLWINVLALVFIVFSAASGTAGYAAHYYWKKYQAVQRDRAELTEKLGENRRQLDRFAGMARIRESTMPRSTMAGVAGIAAGSEGTNGNGAEPSQNGAGAASSTPPDTAPSVPGAGQAGGAQPAATPAGGGDPPQGAAPGTALTDAPQPASGPQPAEPQAVGEKEHPALISEVQIRSIGSRTFRLAFDLSNRDPQVRLNGRVQVAVSTKSGDRLDVTQINRDSLRFIINNYKRVSTEFSLPDAAATEGIAELHLTVTADDQPPVTYSFPMPSAS